ncbi:MULTISPECIES: DUF397 domain-containing protein [Streptomyces]|uniref:DUF397 domain-containing protein n=1 Tax=Streptomyces TaxID=1883 RepID=UPI000789A663|nr:MULTISPECIES: DUF397 domain-containing protein [unclassified Streptomyces]AVH96598.1 DUF397 domain-containing protein [Streptomyces sp. WAC00288]KYG55236.1 DUF397 domain-containing protein [Streptomyces sp. WAC04657]
MIRKDSARDSSELVWFKSSYSGGNDGDSCVEVAATPATVHVRDSKVADGPQLAVGPGAWAGFVAYAVGVGREQRRA